MAAGSDFCHGQLPATGDHLISVASAGDAAYFQLGVIIFARITFDPEESFATLTRHLDELETSHFVLQAEKGQTMDVVVEAPSQVGLTIWGADGIPLKRYVVDASAGRRMEIAVSPSEIEVDVGGGEDGSSWVIPKAQSLLTIPSLPASQDYFVTLTSPRGTAAFAYALDVVIR